MSGPVRAISLKRVGTRRSVRQGVSGGSAEMTYVCPRLCCFSIHGFWPKLDTSRDLFIERGPHEPYLETGLGLHNGATTQK